MKGKHRQPLSNLSGTAWHRNAENSLLDSRSGMDCWMTGLCSQGGAMTDPFCHLPSACLCPSQGLKPFSFPEVCLSLLTTDRTFSKATKGHSPATHLQSSRAPARILSFPQVSNARARAALPVIMVSHLSPNCGWVLFFSTAQEAGLHRLTADLVGNGGACFLRG